MVSRTTASWHDYRTSIGDRSAMFVNLAERWQIDHALYAGSYVDLAPSVAIPRVTYVDMDRRAARYFADPEAPQQELRAHGVTSPREIRFLHGDYRERLDIPDGACDALISLYAGPVWDNCARYLRPGGLLVANTSHGDASIAALDARLTLVGVIHDSDGRRGIDERDLDTYLIPKRPAAADAAEIRRNGRGIAYTRSAFAYVFQLAAAGA